METKPYPSAEELREIGKLVVAERHYWTKHMNNCEVSLEGTGKCNNTCENFKLFIQANRAISNLVSYSIYEGVEPLNP